MSQRGSIGRDWRKVHYSFFPCFTKWLVTTKYVENNRYNVHFWIPVSSANLHTFNRSLLPHLKLNFVYNFILESYFLFLFCCVLYGNYKSMLHIV